MPVLTKNRVDPLKGFKEGVKSGSSKAPIPLKSTAIGVEVKGLFATVKTTRTFRNDEDKSIEATMTFPVPVDSVTHDLRVTVDGRVLVGAAQPKEKARATYEDAVDSGKTAVLHDEVLKGVHTLQVAHVPPGKEVSVEVSWSKPLSLEDSASPTLHIPTTVAEIYGRLPLLPADDLVTSDTLVFDASITVDVDSGVAHLRGRGLEVGKPTMVPLDRPIVVKFTGLANNESRGTSADGRSVTLTVARAPSGDLPLNVGILFDRSGSTGDPIDGREHADSPRVWDVAHAGLLSALETCRADDRVSLWQFDDTVERVGEARGAAIPNLIGKLKKWKGGTEIGLAVGTAAADPEIADIFLVTDGRSAALQVQSLASCGKRVSAVLCGENSLESTVGHLVASTGGQIVVASGDNATTAIAAVVESMRRPASPAKDAILEALPDDVTEFRSAAEIRAVRSGDAVEGAKVDAVGAYAAALALPMMTTEAATAAAVAHGLCTHLTSLVVVDEASEAQEGIPAQRKIPLSRPLESSLRSAAFATASAGMARDPGSAGMRRSLFSGRASLAAFSSRDEGSFGIGKLGLFSTSDSWPAHPAPETKPSAPASGRVNRVNLSVAALTVDWDGDADRLLAGDVSTLSEESRLAIGLAAELAGVKLVAKKAGTNAILVVIGLMARSARDRSRTAERVARRLLKGCEEVDLVQAAKSLGLD